MFTNEMIIDIFFRVINFFTLIGLIIFVYKKFGKPIIDIGIEKKENERESLYNQQEFLEQTQFKLDKTIKKEEQLCNQLKEKINEWKQIIAADLLNRKKERENRIAFLKKRVEIRQQHYKQEQIRNRVCNAVYQKLNQSLSREFKEEKKGQQYLESLIRFMNENIS